MKQILNMWTVTYRLISMTHTILVKIRISHLKTLLYQALGNQNHSLSFRNNPILKHYVIMRLFLRNY